MSHGQQTVGSGAPLALFVLRLIFNPLDILRNYGIIPTSSSS